MTPYDECCLDIKNKQKTKNHFLINQLAPKTNNLSVKVLTGHKVVIVVAL